MTNLEEVFFCGLQSGLFSLLLVLLGLGSAAAQARRQWVMGAFLGFYFRAGLNDCPNLKL